MHRIIYFYVKLFTIYVFNLLRIVSMPELYVSVCMVLLLSMLLLEGMCYVLKRIDVIMSTTKGIPLFFVMNIGNIMNETCHSSIKFIVPMCTCSNHYHAS